MKAFYSITAIILSIFCIIYLLLFSQSDIFFLCNLPAKVSAKEIVSKEHRTLSDSFILSTDQIYQKTLSAHNSFFAVTDFQKPFTIQVTSKTINKLKITLLSDTNKKLTYQNRQLKNTCVITLSSNTKSSFQRIFIKMVNQDTIPHTFHLKLLTTPTITKPTIQETDNTKNTTSNSKKQTTLKSNKKISQKKTPIEHISINSAKQQAISNSTTKKQKLSTIHNKKTTLNPQFILSKPNSVHKLSITSKKGSCSLSDYIIISSNSSVVMIKNNKIYTLQTGFAVLYLQEKKNSANTSSCFVRVIK